MRILKVGTQRPVRGGLMSSVSTVVPSGLSAFVVEVKDAG